MEQIVLAPDDIFVTIQGEGKLTGIPSVFVRVARCNLHCTWNSTSQTPIECDTAYAAYRLGETHKHTVQEIVLRVEKIGKGAKHIVITGGEPLLQAKPLTDLCYKLKERGFHITVETNGTIFDEEFFNQIDLFSISPKLASSAPANEPYRNHHNTLRVNTTALSNLISKAQTDRKDIQLKFVVTGMNDIKEIEKILAQLPQIDSNNILLMPAGSDSEKITATTMQVIDTIIEHGWRFCDRLHIRLFGNTPGK